MNRTATTTWVVGFLAAAGVLAAAPLMGQAPTPTRPPLVVQSGVDLVPVDVVVTSAAGHPVVDLEAANFEIFEDGRRQTVTHCQYIALDASPAVVGNTPPTIPRPLRPEDVRRVMALLVDADRAFPATAQLLARFVDDEIRPDDLAAVVTTRDGGRIVQPFTADKHLLHAAIDVLAERPIPAPESWTQAIGCVGLPADVRDDCQKMEEQSIQHRVDRRLQRRTDGIESVLQALQALPGRKSLVLFSSLLNTSQIGLWSTDARLRGVDDREEWVQSLADLANRSGVVIYTLGLPPAPDRLAATMSREMSRGTDMLKLLARETGGIFVDSGPAALMQAVVQDQRGYYLLGYTPDASFLRRKHHQIRVEVSRPDLVVRTRARYYVPEERTTSVAATSVDTAWLAMTSAFAQTELSLVPADFTADTRGRTVHCAFRVGADGLSFVGHPDGSTNLELQVFTVAFTPGGIALRATAHKPSLRLAVEQAETARRDGLELSGTVGVPGPGTYRVHVVVKDTASGRVGSLNQVVDVRAIPKGTTAASPTDHLTPIALARGGDPRLAVSAVLDGPPKRIAQAAARLLEDARCPQACRQAGVLLHTEAAFINKQLGRTDLEKAHFAAADALARKTAGDREAAVADEFERTWRLAVARRHQEWAEPERALQIYDAVLKQYPNDPDVLLARGTLVELLVTGYQAARMRSLLPADDAQRDYERALAIRPDFAEARLRLGRLLGIAGRSKETRAADARRELRRVLDEGPSALIRAYAHLFLGQVEEKESLLPAAIEEYRAALSVDPRLQPAQLALSRALQKAGRLEEAAAVLLEGLRTTRDGDVHGWYGYHTTSLQSYRASMDRLWQEIHE